MNLKKKIKTPLKRVASEQKIKRAYRKLKERARYLVLFGNECTIFFRF